MGLFISSNQWKEVGEQRGCRGGSVPAAPGAENPAQAAGLRVASSPGSQVASGTRGAAGHGVGTARQSWVLCHEEDDIQWIR